MTPIFNASGSGIEWCYRCQTSCLCNKYDQGSIPFYNKSTNEINHYKKVIVYQCLSCGTTIKVEYVEIKNKRNKKKRRTND